MMDLGHTTAFYLIAHKVRWHIALDVAIRLVADRIKAETAWGCVS